MTTKTRLLALSGGDLHHRLASRGHRVGRGSPPQRPGESRRHSRQATRLRPDLNHDDHQEERNSNVHRPSPLSLNGQPRCCARAVIGHAATLPSSVMKSRPKSVGLGPFVIVLLRPHKPTDRLTAGYGLPPSRREIPTSRGRIHLDQILPRRLRWLGVG
jgi:hypothetical protein